MTNDFLLLFLSPFERWHALTQFYRLRKSIVQQMPYTLANLQPLMLPYFPNGQLPKMGYITASLQMRGLIILIRRQVLRDGYDYTYLVASPDLPTEYFPFDVAIKAVEKMTGSRNFMFVSRGNLNDFDLALKTDVETLRASLTPENFSATKLIIEDLLDEAMSKRS